MAKKFQRHKQFKLSEEDIMSLKKLRSGEWEYWNNNEAEHKDLMEGQKTLGAKIRELYQRDVASGHPRITSLLHR